MKEKILFLLLLISSNIYSQSIDLNIGKANTKNYYEEISFELVNDKVIIPVTIEGERYRFILDTGAPNIISKEIYDLVKPKLIKSIPVTDASGKREYLNVVSLESLKLGNVSFEQTAALVYEQNANPLFKCFRVDGFIGSNMLRNSIIQIDNNKKKLFLTDNKKRLLLNKKESSKIKLVGNQSSPYFWIGLKGENTGKEYVLIDTGASGLYDISKRNYSVFEKKKIFDVLGESKGASAISIFGDVPVNSNYKLLLPSLNINGFELNNVTTTTTNDDNSRVGGELLKYGIMTIDFKNKRFYFSAATRSIDVAELEFWFSKTLKNNKLIVGYVWDKDLKEKMKYGDEIISINDIEINEYEICDLITGNFDSEKQNTITLKIKSEEDKITELKIDKKLPSTLYE